MPTPQIDQLALDLRMALPEGRHTDWLVDQLISAVNGSGLYLSSEEWRVNLQALVDDEMFAGFSGQGDSPRIRNTLHAQQILADWVEGLDWDGFMREVAPDDEKRLLQEVEQGISAEDFDQWGDELPDTSHLDQYYSHRKLAMSKAFEKWKTAARRTAGHWWVTVETSDGYSVPVKVDLPEDAAMADVDDAAWDLVEGAVSTVSANYVNTASAKAASAVFPAVFDDYLGHSAYIIGTDGLGNPDQWLLVDANDHSDVWGDSMEVKDVLNDVDPSLHDAVLEANRNRADYDPSEEPTQEELQQIAESLTPPADDSGWDSQPGYVDTREEYYGER